MQLRFSFLLCFFASGNIVKQFLYKANIGTEGRGWMKLLTSDEMASPFGTTGTGINMERKNTVRTEIFTEFYFREFRAVRLEIFPLEIYVIYSNDNNSRKINHSRHSPGQNRENNHSTKQKLTRQQHWSVSPEVCIEQWRHPLKQLFKSGNFGQIFHYFHNLLQMMIWILSFILGLVQYYVRATYTIHTQLQQKDFLKDGLFRTIVQKYPGLNSKLWTCNVYM